MTMSEEIPMSRKKNETGTGAETIEFTAEPETPTPIVPAQSESESETPTPIVPSPEPIESSPERKATEVVVATFDPARPAHQTMIEGVLANLREAGERMEHELVQTATEILVRSFTASAEQILSAAWGGQSPPAWMGLEKTEG